MGPAFLLGKEVYDGDRGRIRDKKSAVFLLLAH